MTRTHAGESRLVTTPLDRNFVRLGALALGILAAIPAHAGSLMPYKGTDKADTIDFRKSGKAVSVQALGGNDLVFGSTASDVIDGGKGRDTIDPWYGDDVVRGGPGGDYFRYESTFDGFSGFSGRDTICDFAKGDKIDVYISFLDGNGKRKSVSGGNFAAFDTNGDGVLDKKDGPVSIKKVTACGKAKDSLVLDVAAALGDDDFGGGQPGTLTVYGVASLTKSQFVKDYKLSHPY